MNSRRQLKSILSFITLTIFLVLGAGSVETDTDTSKVSEQPSEITISATQLYREYDANQVAADAKYKDKIATVSGRVQNIGKDITDTAYLVIGGEGFLDGVQCMFSEGQQSEIANIQKGMSVTAKGKISGQAIGNVLMRNCSLQ